MSEAEEQKKKRGSRYSEAVITAAKMLYLQRVPVRDIKEQLNLNSERVVYQWAEKGNWDDMLLHETPTEAASRKLIKLIEKDDKTDADYKEIDQLGNFLDKMAGVDIKKAKALKEQAQATKIAEGSDGEGTGRGRKRRSKRNEISSITAERLEEIREKLFYQYQKNWFDHREERTRFILKSRQIGATWFFAWEAFEQAILTGENVIFLSASRSQAEIFKAYICKFALEYFDIELKGQECIELINDGKPWAELRFVSTNSRTAQGYHGHLYIDEVFWIPDFEKLNKLASGMASQKKWRRTYFSTPSVKSHGAYPMWSGEKYNKRRSNPVEFDLTHETLSKGHKGADKIWRNVVNIRDAEAGGCDLFDIEELIDEYSEAEFNNLFMCAFMEAGLSVFNLEKLLACGVDSSVVWVDFKKGIKRPYANQPVWIGYDPARKGDKSTVVVLGVPTAENPRFRILEVLQLRGNFEHQAAEIERLTKKYSVKYIGVDCTGMGLGVYERVKSFFTKTQDITYTLESKTRLVQKGIQVIEGGLMEWDAEQTDIPQAFLQIQQTTTSNDLVTYVSNRKEETGHADVAWAILNALYNDPLVKRKTASIG